MGYLSQSSKKTLITRHWQKTYGENINMETQISMKQGNASSKQPMVSASQAGWDPLVDQLREMNLPLTRENYLALFSWEDQEPTPEQEAGFPESIRKGS